jgi:hypothetical protein
MARSGRNEERRAEQGRARAHRSHTDKRWDG